MASAAPLYTPMELERSHATCIEDLAPRKRTYNACDPCKQGRRKCDGEATCGSCCSRGIECFYTANKPRGRKLKTSPSALVEDSVTSLRLPVMIGPAGFADGPEIRPLTPDETSLIHLVLRFANRVCKVVDPDRFFSAVNAATGSDGLNHHLAVPLEPPSPGLRACFFALLCAASRVCADAESEQAHYRAALSCVDVSMLKPPDEHLISALLLLTIAQFFSVHGDAGDAGALATISQHLSCSVPGLCPDIAVSAMCFSTKTTTLRYTGGVIWPPIVAPVGSAIASRTIEVISFLQLQFVGFFQVESCHVPDFFALLDEAVALEAAHGQCVPDLPITPVALATKALLSHREGHDAQAVAFSAAALGAFASPRILGLSTMFVFSQLLLAVPAICKANSGSCSPEIEATKIVVQDAARRILVAPGGAFSAKPIAKHFLPTLEELAGRGAVHDLSLAGHGAPLPEVASHFRKYVCPFTNPPPSAVSFLPRHPDPSSKEAAVLQALLRYTGEYRVLAEPMGPAQWPLLLCHLESAGTGDSDSKGFRAIGVALPDIAVRA